MNSLARALAILDLFTIRKPTWLADEIYSALAYSRPTGYRYVKELVASGLLQKASAGGYALGARIIQLDYQMRQTDPVLRASIPIMEELSAATGFDSVLSALFGDLLIDIHLVERPDLPSLFTYVRGRPRRPFHGAAAKILSAGVSKARQIRLYAKHHQDAEAASLGSDLETYLLRLAAIRKAGTCLALGEVVPDFGAIGAPILGSTGDPVACLSLAGPVAAIRDADIMLLELLLVDSAERIRDSLRQT